MKPRHETGDPWRELARQEPNPFLPDVPRELLPYGVLRSSFYVIS